MRLVVGNIYWLGAIWLKEVSSIPTSDINPSAADSGILGQYHFCWCPGSWCCHIISIDCEGYTSPGPWFNIKTTSYQYRKSHCGDKTILRPSYLHNGISYTGKMTSLYWIRAQVFHEEEFKQPVPSQCWEMTENVFINMFPERKPAPQELRASSTVPKNHLRKTLRKWLIDFFPNHMKK